MDSFLERLQSDGDRDSIGRFTLDPAKAREKLQKFQLVEPHAYPVHLVAAAVASGATRIDLHLDADDLRLDFDGRPFLAEEMEHLFASLFSTERQAWLIRLKELAIGINAALVLKPRWVDVESWSGREGIHLRVYPERDRLERVRPGPDAGLNTRIHVRQRLGLKKVLRYLSKRTTPEEAALRQRCRLCPVPVRLNGEQLSGPVAIPACLVLTHLQGGPHELVLDCPEAALRLDEPSAGDYSAWLALDHQVSRATLHWVVNGVSYVEPFSLRAWVVTPNMPKDVSQTSLVQGEEWQRILGHLRDARARQLQALALRYGELEPTVQAQAREVLLEALGEGLTPGEPVPDELRPLAEAPLLTLAHGAPVSLTAILEQSRQLGWAHCLTTEGRWPHPPLEGTLIVHLDSASRLCIQRAFTRPPQAGDWQLAAAQQAAEYRQSFEQQIPGEMQFERGSTVFLEDTVAGPHCRVVLGLCTVASKAARIRLYKGGRYLVRKDYGEFPEGLVILADHPDLEPNLRWDGVRDHDPALLEVEETVRGALPALYARAAELAENAQGLMLDQLEQALMAFLVYCVKQRVDPGRVGAYPLFSGYSYLELREQYERLGHLPVTDRYPEVKPLDDTKIVRGHPDLPLLFEYLRSYDHELKAAKQHYDTLARWEGSPRVPVRVPDAAYLVKLTLPDDRGELVLPAGPPHNTVQLYFFREERSLGKRYFPGTPGLGGLPAGMQAALSDDDFPRDPLWAGSTDGPLEMVLARVRPFIDQLFAALGESFPEFEPGRRWAQGYLGSYLSWPALQLDPALLKALALDGVGARRHTLQEVLDGVGREGFVRAVRGEKPLAEVEGLPEPFLRLSDELWSAVERWLGPGTVRDGGDDYQRAVNAQAFWERPVQAAVLSCPVRLRVPLEGALGEVGLSVGDPGQASLHLNVQVLHGGRPLTEWRVPMGPLAGVPQVSFGRLRAVGVVEAAEATPTSDWNELVAGAERDSLRQLVRAAGRRLFLALAAELPAWEEDRDELLSYLWGQLKVETGRQDKGGFEEARREMIRAPLFPLLGGDWASLLDLRQEIERNDRVGYLVGQSDLPAVDRPIVMVRRELLPLLRALLGVQHTADATVTVNALSRANVHRRSAPVEQLQLPEHPYLAVAVLGGQREGRVGLSPVVGGPSRVQLLLERRPLGERRLNLPYTLEAIVNDDQLRANRDFTGVADGQELTRALAAVEEAGNQLVLGQALSWTGDPHSHRPQLREWLIQVACRAGDSPLSRDLLELPLFLTATLDRLSLAQLRRAPRVLALPADLPAEPRPDELLPEGSVALLLSAGEEASLRGQLPLVNYLAGYQSATRFYRGTADQGMLRLPPADYLYDFELALPLRGHVGWLRAGERCTLQLYWRGRECHRFQKDGFPAWQAVVDDHRLEFDETGPRIRSVELIMEVERQLWQHIQERMLRTDWLSPDERRQLWLELGTAREWLVAGPILPSSGPLRSLQEARDRQLPYVLKGEPVPAGPAVLILTEAEAERVQALIGKLPYASEVARPALPPCLVSLRHDDGTIDLELGLAVDPAAAGIEFRQGSRVLGREDLFPGPGFVGWVEGVAPEHARRLLYRFPEELLRSLCEHPEAVRVLASWPPYQSLGPHLPDWLLRAPLFPTTDGGRLSLHELVAHSRDYVPPGAPRPARPVLELEPNGPALRWLEVLFGEPPGLYREPVVTPEERLRAELSEELSLLSGSSFAVELGEGAAQLLFEFEFTSLSLVVNRAHPLVQQALVGRSGARHILLSALASQVLQQTLAEPERRAAERRFHHDLLLRLTPV